MPSYADHFHDLRGALQPLYDAGEAAAIAREALHQATGLSYSQGIVRDSPIPPVTSALLERMKTELAGGRPLQYVTGRAEFRGRSFLVDERVLIPRPETEELVQWIVEDAAAGRPLSMLDVGTGSGCIPVSLALELPGTTVSSCDVSPDALALARQNADRLGAAVRFRHLDFLDAEARAGLPPVDVLVSNPPYIPESLRATLHPNVRDWEPALALFVPEDDALLFYRSLAAFGSTHLNAGGVVYCELHAGAGEATAALFRDAGYSAVDLRADLAGHVRMLRARR